MRTGWACISPNPTKNRLAYVIGPRLAYKRLSFSYEWAEIGADAVFAPIKNPIFGTASAITDVRGHSFVLGYGVTSTIQFTGKINLVERWKETDDELTLYQANFGWRF